MPHAGLVPLAGLVRLPLPLMCPALGDDRDHPGQRDARARSVQRPVHADQGDRAGRVAERVRRGEQEQARQQHRPGSHPPHRQRRERPRDGHRGQGQAGCPQQAGHRVRSPGGQAGRQRPGDGVRICATASGITVATMASAHRSAAADRTAAATRAARPTLPVLPASVLAWSWGRRGGSIAGAAGDGQAAGAAPGLSGAEGPTERTGAMGGSRRSGAIDTGGVRYAGDARTAGGAESDATEALLRRKRLDLAAACAPPR